jgi:hypothetical protein
MINDLDLFHRIGTTWSNMGQWSCHEQLRASLVRWRCTGNSAPWSRWRLTGARHSSRYGAPSSAWFGPTVLRECGDAITLTMRKLQSAWMACDGGFYGATLADVDGWEAIGVDILLLGWSRCSKRQWKFDFNGYLGFDALVKLWEKIQSIGVFVPTCRGFGILTNLSPGRLQITMNKKKLRRG